MRRTHLFPAAVSVLILATVGCKTTYTPADIAELEQEQDAELAAEEERSGETYGNNADAMILEEEEVIRDSDR